MNIEEAGHANVLETPLSRFLSRRFESGHALQIERQFRSIFSLKIRKLALFCF